MRPRTVFPLPTTIGVQLTASIEVELVMAALERKDDCARELAPTSRRALVGSVSQLLRTMRA